MIQTTLNRIAIGCLFLSVSTIARSDAAFDNFLAKGHFLLQQYGTTNAMVATVQQTPTGGTQGRVKVAPNSGREHVPYHIWEFRPNGKCWLIRSQPINIKFSQFQGPYIHYVTPSIFAGTVEFAPILPQPMSGDFSNLYAWHVERNKGGYPGVLISPCAEAYRDYGLKIGLTGGRLNELGVVLQKKTPDNVNTFLWSF